MKTGSILFAALLIHALAFADSVEVTFNAALTNDTEWVYNDGFSYIKSKEMYGIYSGHEGADLVVSPRFGFAITSVVIQAEKASEKTTRGMSIRATSGEPQHRTFELVGGVVPQEQIAFTNGCEWAVSDKVRSFALFTSIGSGNLYLKSAIISGSPLITPPSSVSPARTTPTSIALTWENDIRSISNRVVAATHVSVPETGNVEREYNFDEFNNGGTTRAQTELILSAYPDLGGYMLCLPTNSTGQIQISTRDDKGELTIAAFESYDDLHLCMKARHYAHDSEVASVSIGYIDGNTTNDFATVDLTEEFSRSTTTLGQVPPNARIILNNVGNKKFHRVIIDDIKFIRGFEAAHVVTNIVQSSFVVGNTTAKITGLAPATTYFVTVSSFGEDEIESAPLGIIEVQTTDKEEPFTIKIR